MATLTTKMRTLVPWCIKNGDEVTVIRAHSDGSTETVAKGFWFDEPVINFIDYEVINVVRDGCCVSVTVR